MRAVVCRVGLRSYIETARKRRSTARPSRCCAAIAAIVLLAFFGATTTARAAEAKDKTAKPNLLLLLIDDLGYADVGYQAERKPWIETPNIDALAHKSMVFDNGYDSAPICSPSRAGLLAGRQGTRFGFHSNLMGATNGLPFRGGPHAAPDAPNGEITIAELIKAAGYKTAYLGKWDVGSSREPQKPWNRGFDYCYGFDGHAHSYYHADARPQIFEYRDGKGGPANSPFAHGYSTDQFAAKAAAFITENADRPWFVYLPFNAVHAAHDDDPQAPERVQANGVWPRPDDLAAVERKFGDAIRNEMHEGPPAKRSKRNTMGKADSTLNMAATVRGVDRAVGELVEILKNTKGADGRPLIDNTIIAFTSDNGGQIAWGSNNAPLRGSKGSLWEGGMRVPFFIGGGSATGIQPGENHDMVSTLDFLPTFVAAAGGHLPTDREYDGVNLLPLLTGAQQGPAHAELYWNLPGPEDDGHAVHSAAAIRQGKWKLLQCGPKGIGKPGDESLYDLVADVSETKDVKKDHPQIYFELLKKLIARQAVQTKPAWLSSSIQGGGTPVSQKYLLEYVGQTGTFSGGTDNTEMWSSVDEHNKPIRMTVADVHPNNTLRFKTAAASYTATNDVKRVGNMPHFLNALQLSEGKAAGRTTATIDGGPLMFVKDVHGAEPRIALDAKASEFTFVVENDLILFADLALAGNGAAGVRLNGVISDYSAYDQSNGLKKEGASAFTLGGKKANTFRGKTLVAEGMLELAKAAQAVAIPGDLQVGDGQGPAKSAVVRAASRGQIAAKAKVQVMSDGTLEIAGETQTAALESRGEVSLAGASLAIGGAAALRSGSTLTIQAIGGRAPELAAGAVTIEPGAGLVLNAPADGRVYQIISAQGGVRGEFDTSRLRLPAGYQLVVSAEGIAAAPATR